MFGFPWEHHDLVKRNNDEVGAFHERYPDRIIPFAVLSPKGREPQEAARTVGHGFAGIGELAMYHGGWSLADFEALHPNLELAATRGVPGPSFMSTNRWDTAMREKVPLIPVDCSGLLRPIRL